MDLSNFKTFDFSEGVPYISITSNGITFNKSVIMKMKYPTYVKLLINESDKQIAVQACDEHDDKSVQFYNCLLYTSKLLRIPKYRIYTVDQLLEMVYKKYITLEDQMNLPRFVHVLMELKEGNEMNLKGRHFLTLKDYTPEEILYLVDLAAELKEKKKKGIAIDHYRGMNVALIFEKTSTRTRCSFETAAHDMGMGTTYLCLLYTSY